MTLMGRGRVPVCDVYIYSYSYVYSYVDSDRDIFYVNNESDSDLFTLTVTVAVTFLKVLFVAIELISTIFKNLISGIKLLQ